ncbi:DUF5615 family PIN-like protein [Acidiferrobacter sp.]|uniref:DUF5615 family PIN-like protein n=1 Tax=Acidiferrobacter sp. TaxID=1872107 RepID=UPI0026132109|nr:DUF5615 family PIN-like protein [Acidiferrobacter sp.]
MRFLADENIPLASIQILRNLGHDVSSLSETSPGITDEAVLVLARDHARALLIFDRDYGELIFGRGLGSPAAGVVYLRFSPRTPVEPAEVLLVVLAQVANGIHGHLLVAERDGVRRRPLSGFAEDNGTKS